MNIKFFDVEINKLLNDGLIEDIKNVIESKHFLFGSKSEELEQYFSNYFNSNAILVGSGTDALIISLLAIGIKSGDKVAVPAMSAIPTAIAVRIIGAQPIYIDIDDTMTIDVEILEHMVNKHNIKAIIPVHLYGNTADIESIKCLCNDNYIPIIEDCAQSFGSKINGQLTGTFGTLGAFSFFPTKTLGTFGDAGMILTKDKKLVSLIKELRFYGQISRYKMGNCIGINSRIDEIQATILLKKVKIINEELEKRKLLKIKYDKNLKSLNHSWRPDWSDGAIPHLYPLLSAHRHKIMEILKQKGIETIIHYPFCLPEEVDKLYWPETTKSKKYSQKIYSIPFHTLLTDIEIDYILQTLLELEI
jgi:dTDP-4-amino-4,6-dideoxygalactose transaminase